MMGSIASRIRRASPNHLRVILFAAIVLCALGGTLVAQDAKKPPPIEFSGDLGLVAVSGNTSVSTFSANERFIRRIEKWEFKEDFGSVYGKTGGVESSNLLRAALRADYAFAKHFALYALTAYDRNKFAGIRSRFAEGLGVVAKLIATDVNQLNLEAGYQLTQQRNLIGADNNFSALRAASSWKHLFTKTAYFFQAVEYIPNLENHDDYRINSETAVVAPLSAHIGMKFSYLVRFANDPPFNAAGTAQLRKTDRIFSTGIQVTY